MLSCTFAGSAAEVPLNSFAPGLYLLSVQADGQAPATQRVTVQ